MAVTAQSVIDRVRTQLIDTQPDKRWSDTELLQWLSDGQRALVSIVPDASGTIVNHQLLRGTRQILPDDGILLLDVVRNMQADNTPGRAIRLTTRELLDAFNPNWHNAPLATEAQAFVFTTQQPTTFYVYPPNDGNGIVELSYSAEPAELLALTDQLSVTDMCQTPLTDYVLYRAHMKDSDFAAGQALAAQYFQLFLAALDQGNPADLEDPNKRLSNVDPVVRGGAG